VQNYLIRTKTSFFFTSTKKICANFYLNFCLNICFSISQGFWNDLRFALGTVGNRSNALNGSKNIYWWKKWQQQWYNGIRQTTAQLSSLLDNWLLACWMLHVGRQHALAYCWHVLADAPTCLPDTVKNYTQKDCISNRITENSIAYNKRLHAYNEKLHDAKHSNDSSFEFTGLSIIFNWVNRIHRINGINGTNGIHGINGINGINNCSHFSCDFILFITSEGFLVNINHLGCITLFWQCVWDS